MDQKPNIFQKMLEQKQAAQKNRTTGILSNNDLTKKFQPGEKQQPKIRRGGRNGSGKP